MGSPHHPLNMSEGSSPNSMSSQKWYHPHSTKEDIATQMEGQPDGTFCVRDASTQGDFTLTLRIGGVNKLIKILVASGGDAGKCGFTPITLDFNSVPELIHYYEKHTLKDYNEKLDIRLLHPLVNPSLSEPPPPQIESPRHVLICKLEGLHAEYERVSQRYDHCFAQRLTIAEENQRMRLSLSAYTQAVEIFEGKIGQLRRELLANGEAGNSEVEDEKSREVIGANIELQESRVADIEKARVLMEAAYTSTNDTLAEINAELEQLKPRLVYLHRKRDACKEELLAKHLTQSQLNDLVLNVSACLEEKPGALTEFLLNTPLKWAPRAWMAPTGNKEAAIKAIGAAAVGRWEAAEGVFLIRPSQSKCGYFALSITGKDKAIHHCLIEYKSPQKQEATDECCGYAFANTNSFFPTVVDLVRYYSAVSLGEHNNQLDTRLLMPALGEQR